MTDVFKIQDEIASMVVDELKIKLLGAAPRTKAANPKAYAIFLQARGLYRQFNGVAFVKAIALYKQALAIDPDYAPAWLGLADVNLAQVNNGFQLPDEGIRQARPATERALALDPRYASAHAELGWIALYYDRDLQAAADHLEHALALEPANLDVIYTAALLARRLGRLDEAIALGRYQITHDPVNPEAHIELANTYRYAGRLHDAADEVRIVRDLSPTWTSVRSYLSELLLQTGDAAGALNEIQHETDEQTRLAVLAMANYALGRKPESDAALTDLIKKFEKTSAFAIAYVMAFTGQPDRCFEWIDKAARYHDPAFGALPVYPMFANVRSDARWTPLLRKHGMAPEQLAAIKFDVTVPK